MSKPIGIRITASALLGLGVIAGVNDGVAIQILLTTIVLMLWMDN